MPLCSATLDPAATLAYLRRTGTLGSRAAAPAAGSSPSRFTHHAGHASLPTASLLVYNATQNARGCAAPRLGASQRGRSVNESWLLRRRIPAGLDPEGLDPVLARVLYARKIEGESERAAYLGASARPEDLATLGDPFSIKGMRAAVARILWAMARGEMMAVYGDFDADGVSATTLLASALTSIGARPIVHIPDRFDEGYGLNAPALEMLHRRGVGLAITVDCGIRSVAEVAHAQELGLDVIITDHHTLGRELPPAVAVIDPKQPDCEYPYKELAGVGVAYRLVEALYHVLAEMGWPLNPPQGATAEEILDPSRYLDLVALGTIADIVPLTGENRVLARLGLDRMRTNPRPGLAALMDIAGIKPGEVDGQGVAFRLGPRINAAGRLASAKRAFGLLQSLDADECQRTAADLQAINQKRQRLLEQQVADAQTQAQEQIDAGASILVIDGPDYHEGIVGLVASRLVEAHYVPVLVMRRGEEEARGSARSIEGFNIIEAIDHCGRLLRSYGGHAQAAGFSLAPENVDAFRQELVAYASDPQHLPPEARVPKRHVDAIISLGDLSVETPRALDQMRPFGEANPEPALATVNLVIHEIRTVGQEGNHLKLTLTDGARFVPAIAFRMGALYENLDRGDRIDVVYNPSLNRWNGREALQLVVQAIRPSKLAAAGGDGAAQGQPEQRPETPAEYEAPPSETHATPPA